MISLIKDSKKWDEAAENSYYPYVSYKYGWLYSIGLSFPRWKPLPLASISDEGNIEYLCPCFLDIKKAEIISSPLLAPGFINKNTNPLEMVKSLICYARRKGCGKIDLQVPPGFNYSESLLASGFRLKRKICFFNLDLSGIDSFEYYLNHNLSKGRKSDIKAAWQKGLEIDILTPSEEALNRFYPFYLDMCQRKSAQVLGKEFISLLGQSLRETARYWIARVKGQDAGSAVTFEFNTILWIWLLQADRNFKDYKVDSFLYAEIIRYSIEKKIKTIDLGTSPLDDSLGNYKKRFGAKPVFHELYELDLSLSGVLFRAYVDLKRTIKNKLFRPS